MVILALLRDTATALVHLNSQGLVHRDLQPSNLLINGQGMALVADFGAARRAGKASAVRQV